ncbi:MAG TPA: GNAT family N-acetyltransferase [Blastocatellia bacterium]|nr:GNAT family N-acetyltransferase [Blastocatellia bacterium]
MRVQDFTIREAAEGDFDAAYDLTSSLGYPKLDRAAFAATFAEVLQHPEMVLVVAELTDGRVVALASISHRPQLRLAGKIVTLDELVVAGDARGLGVGRTLLDEAKRLAARLDARRLQLETNRARESYKRGFYVKNGFIEADSAVMRIEVAQTSVCDRPSSGRPTS